MVDSVFTLGVDYRRRIIWFEGGINELSKTKLVKALSKLNEKKGPITFYLSGNGGNFYDCMEIGKAIINSNQAIACIAHGGVYSSCFVLTQFFRVCVGIKGTKFHFHRAGLDFNKGEFLSQQELSEGLIRLARADGAEFIIFSHRANDITKLHEYLEDEAILSIPKAKKLGLMDGYFRLKEFNQDRRLMRKFNKKFTVK